MYEIKEFILCTFFLFIILWVPCIQMNVRCAEPIFRALSKKKGYPIEHFFQRARDAEQSGGLFWDPRVMDITSWVQSPLRALNKKKDILPNVLFLLKSARRDSNPRPPPWQGGAPPLSHSRNFNCCHNSGYIITCNKLCQTFFYNFFKYLL